MTTTWRYCTTREPRPGGGESFAIRELYTDRETGAISWSAEPVCPHGDSWQELADDATRMLDATASQDVLDLTLDPPRLVPRVLPRTRKPK